MLTRKGKSKEVFGFYNLKDAGCNACSVATHTTLFGIMTAIHVATQRKLINNDDERTHIGVYYER